MTFKLAFAPRPCISESFTSWLERLASEYQMGAEELLSYYSLDDPNSMSIDLDQCINPRLASALAHCVDIRVAELLKLRLNASWCLLPWLRTAICPMCWLKDLDHKITPYYRQQWAVPTFMICLEHLCPLMDVDRKTIDPRECDIYCGQTFERPQVKMLTWRYLHIQSMFEGVAQDKMIASVRYGVLRDLLTFVGANFDGRPAWGAAVHLFDMFKIRYWKLPWHHFCSVPIGRPSAIYNGNVEFVRFEGLLTIGYRRLLLLCAMQALPGAMCTGYLQYRECYSVRALAWIRRRRETWNTKELDFLMPIAKRVAW